MSIISQREIGVDTTSFSQALRSALRQDPDVILVGEMRDFETIETALLAAETGHLVFSTLHTVDATETINRIVAVFPPHHQQQIRIQLSGVIEAVISQQLLPNARYNVARVEGRPARSRLGTSARGAWPTLEEVGRVPAVEVMLATPAIRNLVREAKTHQIETAVQTGNQYGMQTMDQSLRDLYLRKLIAFEDAMTRAIHPEELRKMIREAGGEEPAIALTRARSG
jgi:twitching motility protein PilT